MPPSTWASAVPARTSWTSSASRTVRPGRRRSRRTSPGPRPRCASARHRWRSSSVRDCSRDARRRSRAPRSAHPGGDHLRPRQRLRFAGRIRRARPRGMFLHDRLDGPRGLDRPWAGARPARPPGPRARRRRQRPHEPRRARLDRCRGAAEPAPRLLRQRRPRFHGRAADHLGPRPAGRGRARLRLPLERARGDTRRGHGRGVPRARGPRVPLGPHRARPAGAARTARAARAGSDDGAPPPRPRCRDMILLNPGPVNVSPRVTGALGRGDLCHREPEFAALLASIRSRLLAAFAPTGGFAAIVLTGSGTAALEAAVTSVLSPRGRLVVVANGVYGERIAAMAAAARLPDTVVEGAWTASAGLGRDAAAAALLRAGFERQGLRLVLPPELRSNSITALWLPAERSYAALHDGLKASGFVIYEGQGRLQRDIFRVANMGHLRTADFERFLGALDEVLGR